LVSFYHRETGLLHDSQFMTNDEANVEMNTPADHIAIDGHHDRLSQRVDIESGEVVDYQPAQPSPSHEWNESTRRWELSPSAQAAIARRAAARARIADLEAGQGRLLRQHALGVGAALERLRALDDEVERLSAEL
jgi:hypothetical protein